MSSILSFFRIFCINETCDKSSKKNLKKKTDHDLSCASQINMSSITEPTVIILQKNIYKIICNIQPCFFQSTNNKRSYLKNKKLEVKNRGSQSFSAKIHCIDFQNCQKQHCIHNDFGFFKSKTLINNTINDFVSNFMVVYNYSTTNIFGCLNKQVI